MVSQSNEGMGPGEEIGKYIIIATVKKFHDILLVKLYYHLLVRTEIRKGHLAIFIKIASVHICGPSDSISGSLSEGNNGAKYHKHGIIYCSIICNTKDWRQPKCS